MNTIEKVINCLLSTHDYCWAPDFFEEGQGFMPQTGQTLRVLK